MQSFLNTRLIISIHLLIIATVIILGVWGVHESKKELRSGLVDRIEEQLTILEELAVLTDRNGADEVVASIITDCPNRPQFERLLGQLASLEHSELITTQQLFESCGGFYAERKAVMVSRLEREFEFFNENVALLAALKKDHGYDSAVHTWNEIVELEQQRSSLLFEQLTIQRDIISLLIRGTNVLSNEISGLSSRAQNIAEQLGVLDNRIDRLHAELTG